MAARSPAQILVWMRDPDRAAELCRTFEQQGLEPTWVISLPEAVTAVDRCFPCGVACVLDGRSLSLMDVETLLAYLSLGHPSISLPPIPIWALSAEPEDHSAHVTALNLPVFVVPQETGPEGLVAEMVHYLVRAGRLTPEVPEEACSLLLLTGEARVGFYLSRYLGSVGFPSQSVDSARGAFSSLQRGRFEAMVADLPAAGSGMRLLQRLEREWPRMPILAIGPPESWLANIPPRLFPKNLVCVLGKPVEARTLEACLRRVLRQRGPQTSRGVMSG